MQSDITFDNIYIGHSVEDAAKFAEETFLEKHPHEELAELDEKPKLDEKKPPKSPMDLEFMDDPMFYIKEKFDLFMTIGKSGDWVQAAKFVPEVPGAIAALVGVFSLLFFLLAGGSAAAASPAVKRAAKDVKVQAKDAKEKAVDAAASGVESVKAEVNKRTAAAQ